jgi:hypothetical protein
MRMAGKSRATIMILAVTVLALSGVSCRIFPGAWSPDSQRVVLPIPGEDGITLEMLDVKGKPVRTVARPGREGSLSAPSWSPDGKWIAYMRFYGKPPANSTGEGAEAGGVAGALMLQDAESGKEKSIWEGRYRGEEDAAYVAAISCGPDWTSDSKALVVRSRMAQPLAMTFVAVDGKVLRNVSCTTVAAITSAMVAPDGLRIAYADETQVEDRKYWTVHVSRIADTLEPTPTLLTVRAEQPIGLAWSPDGSALYVGSTDALENNRIAATIRRVRMAGGEPDVAWQRRQARFRCMAVSRGAGKLVVQYELMDVDVTEWAGVDTADPDTGRSIPVTYTAQMKYPLPGMGIAPDGQNISFCVPTEARNYVALIASGDGSVARFYVGDRIPATAVVEVARDRLETALEVGRWAEALDASGVLLNTTNLLPGGGVLPGIMSRLSRTGQPAIVKEALAYARVRQALMTLEALPANGRPAATPNAKAYLDEFEKNYPGHFLAQELRQKLAQLTRPAE